VFVRKKWLAVINGEAWILAKVACSKQRLKIYRLIEVENQEPPEDLQRVIKENGLRNKKIDIALSCSGIITRIVILPVLKPKELEKLLTEQVDQYFTLNVEDYLIDYRVLETFQEEGQTRQKVLLAAIPKIKWEEYLMIWENFGIRPKRVDLAADALARLYHKRSTSDEPKDIAIVELNENRVQFILLEHGVFFLYSDQEINLSGLREEKEVSADEEHRQGQKTIVEIETLLMPMLQTLSEFINFFAARHYGKPVDQVYITGTFANVPLLAQVVENSLTIPTSIGFPENWKPSFAKKAKDYKMNWMQYGSLYGLAYRED